MEHTNRLSGQNTEYFNVKGDGTYRNYCALKGSMCS
jgi:hypothetical protein